MNMRKTASCGLALLLIGASPSGALAQSTPGFYYGQVPTPAQWNAAFAAKQDYLGFTPVNRAGDVMQGFLGTIASSTATAGFNLPPGVAPTSPNNGDLWMTNAGLFAFVSGATVGPFATANSSSFAAIDPVSLSFPGNIVTYGLNIDSNFAVVSHDLALASAPAYNLLGNCGASSAEPVPCPPANALTALGNGTAASGSGAVLLAHAPSFTATTGTAPFSVASTTQVANLNSSQLEGGTWEVPGAIGSTTANSGAFTSLSASGTVSGPGFSNYLASPPAIGGTAPNTGSFSSLTDTGLVAAGVVSNAAGGLLSTTPFLSAALGGSGIASPTAHSLLQSEGSAAFSPITAATGGHIVIDQGAGADWSSKAISGDAALATTGALTVTKTNGVAFGPVATLAQGGAGTIVGNPGTSAANQQNFALIGLTDIVTPNMTLDPIMIQNHLTGQLMKTTAAELFGSVGNVTGVNGATGNVALSFVPQGRLTLQTQTPVMTTSQTAKTTIYYDNYQGNIIPVYDGTYDRLLTITGGEISTAIQSTGTGVLNANGVFDVWAVNSSGAPKLCVATNGSGGGWASDTGGSNAARGTGYSQLDLTTRSYITNKNAISHCYNGTTDQGSIVANEATYLGTVMTDSGTAGSVSFTLGTAVAGGGAAVIGLWNEYNRIPLSTTVKNSTAAWTYASTTIENANASANMRITAVFGLAEEQIQATYNSEISPANNAACYLNVGLDATAFSGNTGVAAGPASGAGVQSTPASLSSFFPQIGLHFIQATAATNANSCTFNNFVSPATPEYLQGSWRY